MAELLNQHQSKEQEKKAAGSAYEDNGFIFATTIGTPFHSANLRNRDRSGY